MQHANPTRKIANSASVSAAAADSRPSGDGFIEIAVLSLAGLAVSFFMIAHGMFADGLPLMFAQ